MSSTLPIQISAVLTLMVALGFGLPVPWVVLQLRRTGALPTFMGLFPMYGGPLFARVSHSAFTAVLWSFALVCALEVVAGWLLWRGRTDGALLTLALLPLEVAYWIAFALPIPPMLGVVRIGLLLVAWETLR